MVTYTVPFPVGCICFFDQGKILITFLNLLLYYTAFNKPRVAVENVLTFERYSFFFEKKLEEKYLFI
jgi:hypothetical protein